MTAVALVIRERRESDIESVIRLAERVHDLDGYPPYLPAGDYRAFLFAHETLGSWVAEIDGQIVGQVALHPHTGPAAMDLAARVLRVPAERLGVVARLLVSPGYRRQGVAGELLFAAARAALGQGRFPMLDVAARFPPAVALYERSGWMQAGAVTLDLPSGTLEEYVYVAPAWLRPTEIAGRGGPRHRWDGPRIEA